MPLTAGTRLGSYEIVDPLGAGGMGEVYRAHDTRLHRDVAIKVLPAVFAADRDRLARFEREATTLASLNHPNIAQVHGLTDDPLALVMELVPGEDLAQRLSRGPLPLEEAIAIARQIAEALEAAHDQGIVHRDLKPANVRIRPDGTVKVLDFGLAKAAGGGTASGSGAAIVDSPTFTSPAMTQLGMILGTAAYMSPEQARGKPVDRRADIWAFGCVLYEMLTARSPFTGEDVSMTLAAILNRDPDLARLPAGTPPAVRRLLQRCFEKDPRRRLGWIGEVRVALEDASAGTDQTTSAAPTRTSWLPAYAIGGLLLGSAATWLIASRSTDPAIDRPPDLVLRRLTEVPGLENSPDISPDGRQIVYASQATGQLDVYLLRVGAGRAINLTAGSTDDDHQAAFSPDGERIAFRSERDGGGIFTMGVTGDSVRRLTTAGFDPAWSPDMKTIAYSTEGVFNPYVRTTTAELWTADTATGRATRVHASDAVQPAWSPDGKQIAFWANKDGQRDIWIIPSAGGTPVPVTSDAATDWSPEWSPDGRWLYFSSDRGGPLNIWRVAIASNGAPVGEPQAVTHSLTGVGQPRFAADASRMSVMGHTRSYELSVPDFDPKGIAVASTIRSPSLGWCSPSPKGDWLVCTAHGAQEDIVLLRSDGSETVRLTDDAPKDRNPTWSPDGDYVTFMSTRGGTWAIWSIRRDGSDLRQMTDFKTGFLELFWSADGKQAMASDRTTTPYGTWIFDPSTLATRASAQFLRYDSAEIFAAEANSPDMALTAGALLGSDRSPLVPAVWDRATKTVRKLDVPVMARQFVRIIAGWLDARRFVMPTPGGLAIVDARTGAWTKIPAPLNGSRYRLSADNRKLMIEWEIFDGDVWLLEAKR